VRRPAIIAVAGLDIDIVVALLLEQLGGPRL
jgi:hypothetical protein